MLLADILLSQQEEDSSRIIDDYRRLLNSCKTISHTALKLEVLFASFFSHKLFCFTICEAISVMAFLK